MSEAQTKLTPRQEIAAFMQRHSLAVESVFVPWTQSRNKGAKDERGNPILSLNWRVALVRKQPESRFAAARSIVLLETDYSAGAGHCPAYKKSPFPRPPGAKISPYDRRLQREAIAAECETGLESVKYPGVDSIYSSAKRPIKLDVESLMHSLALDSDVLDSGGFENWAAEFGYDSDSRSAEKIFNACLEIALKMRAAIGETGLAELRQATQDF